MLLTSLLRIGLTRSLAAFHFTGRYDEVLDYKDLDQLGLYVHIPFCRSLCSFCPYCKEVYDLKRANAYKQALLQEIRLVSRSLTGKKAVTSLYFGGGTPALMLDDLKDIISELEKFFEIRDGIGVELHPCDITADNLRKLKAAGVTMVSLGIQTFDSVCLEKLGRAWEPFADKVQMVQRFGFATVDVDLIFAIPGQTDQSLAEDVDLAFASGATQVSTYPFIDFTFADNSYKPMTKTVKLRMLKHLTSHCRQRGLVRTSVWTHAKPDTEKYSSVTRDAFLGFGVSATSLLRSQFKINTFSLEGYIERIEKGHLATSLTLDFTRRQRAVYFLFWSAYGLVIGAKRFQRITGEPMQTMFARELSAATFLGILRKQGEDYYLTEQGASLFHTVEQVYTTAYIDKMWNISRKVAFPREIILK